MKPARGYQHLTGFDYLPATTGSTIMNVSSSLPSSGGSRTSTSALNAAFSTSTGPTRYDTGGLDDTPAGITDRDALLKHCGRNVMHASVDRSFKTAYRCNDNGEKRPVYYRVTSRAFTRCQYVMLTTKQYAPVLVVDIDQPGTPGGHPSNLAQEVRDNLAMLIQLDLGPAWVGINPVTGRAQAIWLIDPVYADKTGRSPNMTLLSAASRALGELLDHDPHFSHRFSRSPFYHGDDPTAYRWYCQHKRVHRLAELLREVRTIMGTPVKENTRRRQFTSGRDLIDTVKKRRKEAEAFKAIAQDVENDLGDQADQYDPELIDGVRVLWISRGRAARDETAFRHALKTGHRLRAAGQRLTDAALIDDYEHAYTIAQREGADGREAEMPPMRDRQTMARRVRGYVTHSKTHAGLSTTPQRATSAERKALATMGRKGGQKAAERWKNDPNGKYAQNELKRLNKANSRRSAQGRSVSYQIAAYYDDAYSQTEKYPTVQEAAEEFGVSNRTVQRALSKAGIQLPTGRRKKGDTP